MIAVTVVAVAGLTAALIVSPLAGRGHPAYAATPPLLQYMAGSNAPSASVALRQLAAQAQRQPSPTSGHYHYLDLQEWSLWSQISHGEGDSRVVPSQRRAWIADDGSGRTESLVDGRQQSRTLEPGESRRLFDVGSLSRDPATLAGQLAVGHPTGYGVAEMLVAVTDLWREQALPPELQAAVLRLLADQPGLVNRGRVFDRAGRPGIAISVDSDYSGLPTRYTIIFDDSTGMLRDYEETLTTTAGKLNVPIPSVISYTIWRGFGDVNHVGDSPSGP
jgi:hypothetical protein